MNLLEVCNDADEVCKAGYDCACWHGNSEHLQVQLSSGQRGTVVWIYGERLLGGGSSVVSVMLGSQSATVSPEGSTTLLCELLPRAERRLSQRATLSSL